MASASGIYCWTHIKSGKRYIGQSLDVFVRKVDHERGLNKNKHFNDHLQSAWKKYGKNCFEFSVLEFCPKEILNWREVEWINKYKSTDRNYGYNYFSGGEIRKHTQETKRKISQIQIGRKQSAESNIKRSIALKGRIKSQEHRYKLSLAKIGKFFTDDHKSNLRKAWIVRKKLAEVQ